MIRPFAVLEHMSRVMRKPISCICEPNGADQRLSFRYIDSEKISLLRKSEISSLWPFSVVVPPDLCRTWWENAQTGFQVSRLIYCLGTIYVKERKTENIRISFKLIIPTHTHYHFKFELPLTCYIGNVNLIISEESQVAFHL